MVNFYKCKVELSDDNWYSSWKKQRKYLCKPCHNSYQKAYKRTRYEASKAYNQKYYWDNREAILAKSAADRQSGRANIRAQAWRDANREHYRAYQREYQAKLRAKRRDEPVIEFITTILEPMLETWLADEREGLSKARDLLKTHKQRLARELANLTGDE